MQIELVDVETLKLNVDNPRKIKPVMMRNLIESIKTFPQMLFIRPIVVDNDLNVLGGNMRLLACKKAGIKEVPIIRASDLNEEQKTEFILKDNISYGSWDYNILTDFQAELLNTWTLDTTKFDVDDKKIDDYKPIYQILINFENEIEQHATYDKLISLGITCKLLIL